MLFRSLNMSESQVQRLEYLDGHLNDGFKQLMAAEKLPSTVATMISKLPEEDQAALLQRQREDPAAFNTGTVMNYLREKSKAVAEQAATDDTGAELTVGVLQTKVNSQKEKSPAKFARPKKGITKQAGEKMYRQPGWNWQLA